MALDWITSLHLIGGIGDAGQIFQAEGAFRLIEGPQQASLLLQHGSG